MTKFQSWITALLIFFTGVGLLLLGIFAHQDVILGLGIGIMGSGLTALGIPRPADLPTVSLPPSLTPPSP